ALFPIATFALGETWLAIDREQMDPREYYVWTRWWNLLLMSGYATSVFVTAEWLLELAFRKVIDFAAPPPKQ
ncbi:MAG: hypothetical protein SFU86_24505, partial [Pirellulaceae bacterium]|nr:hypothetical protein [Pirellulaceae bacterium]